MLYQHKKSTSRVIDKRGILLGHIVKSGTKRTV